MDPAHSSHSLPIDAHLTAIKNALTQHPSLIIKAEPASGKTTRVPPALLDTVEGTIIVLEPRRLAARLSAEYIAAQRGEMVGETVGYQIRFESKMSAATRIRFVTEGVFTRLIQDNPLLQGIGCVIVDEFHERHIQTDVALAYCRAMIETQRPDLRLLVMSATLDTAALESYLQSCAVFDIKGRSHRVAIEYMEDDPDRRDRRSLLARALGRMLDDERCPANILIFLTGIQEIHAAIRELGPIAAAASALLLPLTAEISPDDQKRVFGTTSQRKIIVSTNVAETSLTLPDITGVIDLGLAKIPSHAAWSALTTLDVKKVCSASCIQRAGRAGRTREGVCYRLYSEADFFSRPRFLAPEICRLDLAQTMLESHALFAADDERARGEFGTLLPWFELPTEAHAAAARTLLVRLGALDTAGSITTKGRMMAAIPLHPRLAALILEGQRRAIPSQALLAACLINEDMILDKGEFAVDVTPCDIRYQMGLFLAVTQRSSFDYSQAAARMVDPRKVSRISKLYEQLAGRLHVARCHTLGGMNERDFSMTLLAGFPDRIAKLRGATPQRRAYNLCLGRGGILDRNSTVRKSELIIAIDATESHSRNDAALGTQIRVASEVSPELLTALDNDFCSRSVMTRWDGKNECAFSVAALSYGNLLIGEQQIPEEPSRREEESALLARMLSEKWPYPFGDDNPLTAYHARLDILGQLGLACDLPRFEGELLGLFFSVLCENRRAIAQILELNLADQLNAQLSAEQISYLEETLPTEIRLKNGKSFKIHYTPSAPPWISGKIQDFFGCNLIPSVARSRLNLTVRLLAPNGRPAQITNDVAGFWKNSYPKLANELGRLYPRHYWPDTPASARPFLLRRHALSQG